MKKLPHPCYNKKVEIVTNWLQNVNLYFEMTLRSVIALLFRHKGPSHNNIITRQLNCNIIQDGGALERIATTIGSPSSVYDLKPLYGKINFELINAKISCKCRNKLHLPLRTVVLVFSVQLIGGQICVRYPALSLENCFKFSNESAECNTIAIKL